MSNRAPVHTGNANSGTIFVPEQDCSDALLKVERIVLDTRGGTLILGHTRDVRPEWVTFPGRKPADGCKFLTKNLRMGHNFDIIYLGMGAFPLN